MAGKSLISAGLISSVLSRKPTPPTTVHSRYCNRSGATTPPEVMKSAHDGWKLPEPLLPASVATPDEMTPVPTEMATMPGRLDGTSDSARLPCTNDLSKLRYSQPASPANVL